MHYNGYNKLIINEQQKNGLQSLYSTNDVYILCKPKLLYDAASTLLPSHLQNERIGVCKFTISADRKGMPWNTLSAWR